jgi:hypothetical protein
LVALFTAPRRMILRKPPDRNALRSDWLRASTRLSDSFIAETAAWPWRSSGTKPAPSRRRAVIPCVPGGLLRMTTSFGIRDGILARDASNNSPCPLPATPAIARISPEHTSATRLERHGEGRPPAPLRLEISSCTAPLLPAIGMGDAGTSLPTIMRASEAGVSSRGNAGASDLAVAQHGGAIADAFAPLPSRC